MGIEPTLSAWKAEVLPLNYTRAYIVHRKHRNPAQLDRWLRRHLYFSPDYGATHLIRATNFYLEGEGFEPSKAMPSDLQSDPFDRSGTPP